VREAWNVENMFEFIDATDESLFVKIAKNHNAMKQKLKI
jgi:hypothetical protein